MDENIKQYAESLYEKTRFDSSQQVHADRITVLSEMARRHGSQLPMGGSELSRVIKVYVQHIERCMQAKLDCYRKAFEESGQTPSQEDLKEILTAFRDSQEREIKNGASYLNNFVKTRGLGDHDLTGSLTEGSAKGHDRVLHDWNIWRQQTRLKSATATSESLKPPAVVERDPEAPRSKEIIHDKSPMIFLLVGIVCSILPWGASLIGITVNLWLGALVLLASFCLMGRAFWVWERASRWHVALRTGTVVFGALIYFWLIGYQIRLEYQKDHRPIASQKSPGAKANSAPSHSQAAQPSEEAPTESIKKKPRKRQSAALVSQKQEAPTASGYCYLDFFGQVINGTVLGMAVNQGPIPVDDVEFQTTQLLYKNPSDSDTDEKLVGWQKSLNVGTCRAKLWLGLDERFPIGNNDKLIYRVLILTRFQTFRETIKLQRHSQREYDEELALFRGADQKPLLTLKNIVPIAP